MDRYNRLAEKFRNREKIVGTHMTMIASPFLLECMDRPDLDFMLFDTEHGIFDTVSVAPLLQICRLMGLPSIVRVQDSLYHLVAKALDMGADGVMIPRTESLEQLRAAVDGFLFYPDGRKGRGGHAQSRRGEAYEDYAKTRFLLPQIESPRGIELLPSMLEEYGDYISAIIVGPTDLSITLGVPRKIHSPQVTEAVQKVFDICKAYDKSCGIYCNDEAMAKKYWDMGGNVLWTGKDKDIFMERYTQMMDGLREIQ